MNQNAIVMRQVSQAEQEISAAWQEYQATEKCGLAFGKACCKWRDKFGAQGSRKGKGLAQILRKLGIKEGKAYYWMNEYEISIGKKEAMDVHYSSETAEWYTPPEIVRRVELVLGKIDLDPCAGNGSLIPAAHCFTEKDDGLRFDWCGRVYMNPPYGDVIGDWVKKLVNEYAEGRTKQAIALVPARVDTEWWRLFRDSRICFVNGRLRFSGAENSAPFPSALAYLGNNHGAFRNAFRDIGEIWMRDTD